MEEVPENAQLLPAIQTLDFSNNKIKLYTSLSTYPSLTELNLAHNRLTGSLHVEVFAQLKALKVLDVSHNRLTSVSAAVETLRNTLQSLDVSHNRLRRVKGIDACYNLSKLNISHNLLASGLAELETLRQLRVLDFRGNPICEEPGVGAEIKGILPYVRRLNGREIQPLVSPRIETMRSSRVVEVEEKMVEEKTDVDLDKFSKMIEDSIARKERLLRKLPVVF